MKYISYEQGQHPEGLVYQGEDICCREIRIKLCYDEGHEEVEIFVENVCDPRYTHLDPQYRCEERRCRESCISQMDESLIDESGKPKHGLPGSWDASLKSNAELPLVFRYRNHEYVDFLWESDFVIRMPGESSSEDESEYQSSSNAPNSGSDSDPQDNPEADRASDVENDLDSERS